MASFTSGPVATVGADLMSVTISWSADAASYGQVFYGLNVANFDSNFEDMNFVTDHSVLLTNLQAGQTYYFVVNIQDINGNTLAESANLSFSTVAAPVTITDGPTADATPTTSEIAWSASAAGTGMVNLGTTQASMNQVLTDPTVSQDHAVTAQGLVSGTQYFYTCSNVDPSTGTVLVTSPAMNFTTQPAPPPTGGLLYRAQASPRLVAHNGSSQLSVLLSKGGKAIANVPVTFAVTTGNGDIVAGGNMTISGTVNTDATGKAVVSFKAGAGKKFFAFVKITSPNAVNSAFLALIIRRH
jgi:hypothetical protein